MRARHRGLGLGVGVALLAALPASAYIRTVFNFGDGSSAPLKRADVSGIQFYVNGKIAPGTAVFTAGSDPVSGIQAALAAWNALPASGARFLQLKTTDKAIDPSDGQNTIAVGSTAGDLSVVGGALAVTASSPVPFAQGSTPTGDVSDADIIINPAYVFSTDGSTTVDLQAVMTHELGHVLGASHNGLWGATMFQAPASPNYRFLTSDETAFVSAIYPASGVTTGTISGKVLAGDGSPVQEALVTLTDTAGGVVVGSLTGQDGSYSVQVPPASYAVHVEPITAGSVVQPGNLYLTTATKVTSGFQATVLGGASPTLVTVPAGGSATAPNLTVASGTSALQTPAVGIVAVGGKGDNLSVYQGGTTIVNSGAVDIALIGGGVDGSISVQVLGQGITVRPNTLRVDSSLSFGGSLAGLPLVRFTVDVASRSSLGLASLIITKGQSTLAMSGAFVLVPAQPTISSVQDAESGQKTIVPGGWVAVYGSNLASSTRVWASGDFLNGNVLPPALGGVTVQFNGTPAAVFVASSGQINAQAPSGISGKVTVTVTNNGAVSAPFTATAVPNAPSLFVYPAGGKLYPAAVHLSATLVGDPAAQPGSAKALAGETLIFFVNGLAASPGGSVLAATVPYTNPVTVTIGTASVTPSFAGLVAAGEYQLNVVLPSNLAPGNYPISVSTQGQTSPAGVTLPVGP